MTSSAQDKPNYPAAKQGYKRVDLILPKIDNEKDYKIEVRFGQLFSITECAEGSFSFKQDNLKQYFAITPYRFPYYVLESEMCEFLEGKNSDCKSTVKVSKKILSSTNILIEYQSTYPRPFYIPETWTVEYRIWAASDYISLDN